MQKSILLHFAIVYWNSDSRNKSLPRNPQFRLIYIHIFGNAALLASQNKSSLPLNTHGDVPQHMAICCPACPSCYQGWSRDGRIWLASVGLALITLIGIVYIKALWFSSVSLDNCIPKRLLNTLKSVQNGQHVAYRIIKCVFRNENYAFHFQNFTFYQRTTVFR